MISFEFPIACVLCVFDVCWIWVVMVAVVCVRASLEFSILADFPVLGVGFWCVLDGFGLLVC